MLRRQRGRTTSASAEGVANAAATTHPSPSSNKPAGGTAKDAAIAAANQAQRVLVREDLVGGQVHFLGRHVQRLAHLPRSSPHKFGVTVFTQSLSGEYLKFKKLYYFKFEDTFFWL